MLSYMTIGANDVPRSGRFYTAILTPLGYQGTEAPDAVEFTSQDAAGRVSGSGTVYVKKPFNGQDATAGNGCMVASKEMVRKIHAAGIAAGGSDEGTPGFRDEYSDHLYVGYLRDPWATRSRYSVRTRPRELCAAELAPGAGATGAREGLRCP